jgi:hypothetical protein
MSVGRISVGSGAAPPQATSRKDTAIRITKMYFTIFSLKWWLSIILEWKKVHNQSLRKPSENILNETKTVFIVSIYSKEIGFTQQHPRFECSHRVVDQPRWSWELKGVHSFIVESSGLPGYLRLAECLVSQVFSHPEP